MEKPKLVQPGEVSEPQGKVEDRILRREIPAHNPGFDDTDLTKQGEEEQAGAKDSIYELPTRDKIYKDWQKGAADTTPPEEGANAHVELPAAGEDTRVEREKLLDRIRGMKTDLPEKSDDTDKRLAA